MKTFFKWVGNVLLILLVVLAVLSGISFIKSKKNPNSVPAIGPYKFMAVLSGSMSPTFNVYDMIIDKKADTNKLNKGDVITYWSGDVLVTHRVVEVREKDNKRVFKTKGDANNVEDDQLVEASNIEGIYLFRIPYMGLVVSKLRGPIGLAIVWILLIYVVFSEFLGGKGRKETKEI